jgi:hypothetical protein
MAPSPTAALSTSPSARSGWAVYLASRFARRDEMKAIAAELEHHGYEVTSRWLTSTAALATTELEGSGRAAELATMDLEDVRRASVCIVFTEPPEQSRPGRGGRHTELGIALALGLRVMLVGPREHVFHCLPDIEQFRSWSEARTALLRTGKPIAA